MNAPETKKLTPQEMLENLKKQQKEAEVAYWKISGAIEVLEATKVDSTPNMETKVDNV